VRLKKNAKIELLGKAPLFAGCSKSDLAEIAAVADEMDVDAGTTLINEGQRGRQFFVVVDGTVEVRRKGRKVPIRGGSEFFGEISLLSNRETMATVTTTSPAHLLVITDRAFRQVLERKPQIQLRMLQALAERVPELS
jgi:CRP-like cAMP-binding protein